MKIEFWSDIVCPFCGLMDPRVHQAVDRFEHGADVELVHRSFQIHPDLPRSGVTQRELLEEAGASPSVVDDVLRPIEFQAETEGFVPFIVVDRVLGPTDLAHELLAYATDRGRGNEIWSSMFRAHFGQGQELWTAVQVLGFAAQMGLDVDEVAVVLEERRYRTQVLADQLLAQRLGARGAPFLVLDGKYALSGAVDVDTILAALRQAWDARDLLPEPSGQRSLDCPIN